MSVRKRVWTNAAGEVKDAWLVDYKDQAGKRRHRTFKRKKDAEKWLNEAIHEIAVGIHTPDANSPTVSEAGDVWLDRAEANRLEPSTLKQYKTHLRLHINPLVGSIKLSRLSRSIVEKFVDDLLKTRSRAMAKKILRSLTMILSEAERRGMVSRNAARDVKIKTKIREKRQIEIPTTSEIRSIIAATTDLDRALVLTLVLTGVRASELRGLRWCDINEDSHTISINQRADEWGNIGPPKSKSGRRTIPAPQLLIDELKKWKTIAPSSTIGLVFPARSGRPHNLSNLVRRTLQPIQIRAGVFRLSSDGSCKAKYSPHDFRHAAASRWIKNGVDFKRLQKWMGHENVELTLQIYGHLIDDAGLDAALIEADAVSLLGAPIEPSSAAQCNTGATNSLQSKRNRTLYEES